MKRIVQILFIFIFTSTLAQEITQQNYEKICMDIWDDYTREITGLHACSKKTPEKRDSLKNVALQFEQEANRKMVQVAIQFISLPEGLMNLYKLRLRASKETLQHVLDSLPAELSNSAYGKSIRLHIETEQVKEGGQFPDFAAKDFNGKEFKLSSLKNKNILFLYGGMDCMGEEGRNYLKKIYDSTSRSTFEIVVYCPVATQDELEKCNTTFPSGYILISDFLLDHSPIKIKCGAQATPTSFFIDKNGTVDFISIGLPVKKLDYMLQNGLL